MLEPLGALDEKTPDRSHRNTLTAMVAFAGFCAADAFQTEGVGAFSVGEPTVDGPFQFLSAME